MPPPNRSSPPHHQLKHRTITCLNKLSDRDTHTIAITELEQIVKSLSHDSFSPFLTCIYDTDSSEKTQVRKQCVRLLGLLSSTHGEALSPHLSKMVSAIIKRLHDSDSVVRSACIDSLTTMSKQPCSSLLMFLKPLMETLLVEQDCNSQMGSALCLSSVIDASEGVDAAQMQRVLPKLVKLLKCESFKAKPALLSLIRSVIGVGGSMSRAVLGNLVSCLVEFLSSEDWAVRKGAAEAFLKLALVYKDLLPEFKSSCLTSFESRKFDKVKIVRETMCQMIEAWKDVDGASGDNSASSQSRDKTNSECSPSSSVSSNAVGYDFPQAKRTTLRRCSFPPSHDSSAMLSKKRIPLRGTNRTSAPVTSHKLIDKRATKWKAEVALPRTLSFSVDQEDNSEERSQNVQEPEKVQYSQMNETSQRPNPEGDCNFFSKNNDEKTHKFGVKFGSRVVPYNEESSESTVSNDTDENYGSLKEDEDLSLIQKQLLQIENQQSSLLDLLQRFMGSSQNGIISLETRVNGLERALDEIMYDLDISPGRVSPKESSENTCCKLPGADFLKYWRKSEGRYPTSKFTCADSVCSVPGRDGNMGSLEFEDRWLWHQAAGGGFAVNPLAADLCNDIRSNSDGYTYRMPTSIIQNGGRRQARNGSGF